MAQRSHSGVKVSAAQCWSVAKGTRPPILRQLALQKVKTRPGVPKADVVRQAGLFGAQNSDGWGVDLTILTALGNLLAALRAGRKPYLSPCFKGRAAWRPTVNLARAGEIRWPIVGPVEGKRSQW